MSGMDFNRPYGTVYDMPGVVYQQDGIYFLRDGRPVNEPPADIVDGTEPASRRVTTNDMNEDDLRRPENRSLKQQLDVYGEEWTTRKAALAFLEKGRA